MEDYNIIEVDSDNIVEVLKMQTSLVLSTYYEKLKRDIKPSREDYTSEEEYQIVSRMQELELIDQVKEIKHLVFSNILNMYNEFIIEKNGFDFTSKKQNEESIQIINYTNSDIKRAGIITIGVTILLPIIAPIVIVFNIPRIGIDLIENKYHSKRLYNNIMIDEELKKVQDPFYELVDTLRSDYHKSNKELKQLEDKALHGVDISTELIEFLDPERVNLERIEIPEELFMEKNKEYIMG